MDANKKLIIKIGIVFVCILLFITFFSSTIYNFNLPSVVVEYPRNGVITSTAEGRGVVDFAVKDSYYAVFAGKITLAVSEGETVAAGSKLYSIIADVESLRQTLEEYILNGEKAELRLEKAVADRQYAQERLNNFRIEEAVDGFDTSEYDYEIQKIQSSINNVTKELEGLIILYEHGAAPKKDVDEKQRELDDLNKQYEQQLDRKQKAIEDYNKSFDDRRKELEISVSDLQYQIDEVTFEINANCLEIEKLDEQIAARGEIIVFSDRDGIVQQIGDGIDTGAYITKNELVMKIGVTSEAFKTVVELPESVDFLSVGDAVTFNIKSRNMYGLSGEIKNLTISNGRLKAEIQFAADGLSGGETAEIKIEKTSELYDKLIPNRALRSDSYGDYILCAEMVKGFFGYEYYARRQMIWIQSQDNYNTAIGIYANDAKLPVIINSDKAISEGDRIRIVGGSDLVEIR